MAKAQYSTYTLKLLVSCHPLKDPSLFHVSHSRAP
ncbi:hypothetical protein COLO4_04245 [Corchorus olitorius]|uniref:Uncharacterized protein n=1 Tax=Corchorus olitorius TaxID=93759 RepID=A0A1R3KUV8_9ROSI|nr:hypothetical protein COLO4_04245 [Corchorus olitorius]